MTTFNLTHTGQEVDDAVTKVKAHISPIDTTPTLGSTAAVTSGSVKTELTNLQTTLQSNIDAISTPSGTRGHTVYTGDNLNSGTIFENTTGKPLFVGFSMNAKDMSRDFISFVLLEMANSQANFDGSAGDPTNGYVAISMTGNTEVTRAAVSGIIPAGKFWRLRYSDSNFTGVGTNQTKYYYSFQLA